MVDGVLFVHLESVIGAEHQCVAKILNIILFHGTDKGTNSISRRLTPGNLFKTALNLVHR